MIDPNLGFDPREVKKSLARRDFWHYCEFMLPAFYKPERAFLREIAHKLQDFYENSHKHILIINAPPRHGKSLTAQNFVEWILGRNPHEQIMTASYNSILSTTFSKKVRDTIQQQKIDQHTPTYSEIFTTKIKHGEASANIWATEGNPTQNYIATSPDATATGFGATLLIIDDIIKSASEAYNQNTLDKHWEWFTNTALQRLEQGGKIIVIMTRWATGDLAGRIMERYDPEDIEIFTAKAVQDNGEMLCPEILDRKAYELKTQEMNPDIVEANYNQKPLDVKGRLYADIFKEWASLPPELENAPVYNFTDTADTGTDFLCSINYKVLDKTAYILDIVFSDEPMETTENLVTDLFVDGKVYKAEIESNNGGRGFARTIKQKVNNRGHFFKLETPTQTHNKESRILTSSSWVQENVIFPIGWKQRHRDFSRQLLTYNRKGKNPHDDALDVLASIYERVCGRMEVKVIDKASLGLNPNARNRRKPYWH